MVKWRTGHIIIIVFILLYFFANLLFIERFPFVHSDETWLAGLSRYILHTGKPGETEPFFDLYERHPHGLRVLFQGLQIAGMKLFGYSLRTVRGISLLFAAAALYVYYRLIVEIEGGGRAPFFSVLLLAFGIQFLYAGRFGRQESVLLFIHLLSLYFFFKSVRTGAARDDVLAGTCIAAAAGVHPNAFILFLPLLFLYVYRIAYWRDKKIGNLVFFLLPAGAGAAVFTGISLYFDPSFVRHYLSYGSTLGVDTSFFMKLRGVSDYFYKLFFQISGTYYTPCIRGELLLFCCAGTAGLGFFIAALAEGRSTGRRYAVSAQLFLILFAVLASIVLIGRYGQPSVVFLFPSALLLLTRVLSMFLKRKAVFTGFLALLLLLTVVSSSLQMLPWLKNNHYRQYLSAVRRHVPEDAVVLANINAEPAFLPGNLYDYRNLTYLREHDSSFREYIEERNIEYIILPEEMEVIYNSRPVWNIIYGNIWPYYSDMLRFLAEDTVPVGEFTAPVYAMRITRYQNRAPWKARVYRVSE